MRRLVCATGLLLVVATTSAADDPIAPLMNLVLSTQKGRRPPTAMRRPADDVYRGQRLLIMRR